MSCQPSDHTARLLSSQLAAPFFWAHPHQGDKAPSGLFLDGGYQGHPLSLMLEVCPPDHALVTPPSSLTQVPPTVAELVTSFFPNQT